ncbi:MAG: ATP-binding protein [Rhizobiaceae bacterium]
MHPSVVDPRERAAQARLVGVLLAGPVLAAAAIVQTSTTVFGIAPALAAACMVMAIGWLSAVTVVTAGARTIAPAAVGACAVLCAGTIAVAGGVSSPLALMALTPLVETLWIGGRRRSTIAAAALAPAILVGQAAFSSAVSLASAPPSGLLWIVPLAYLASVAIRFGHAAERQRAQETASSYQSPLPLMTLNVQGDVVDTKGPVEARLGIAAHLVEGRGLFERIHVSDRVAFLCAVADAAGGNERTVEFRLRRPANGVDADDSFTWLACDLARSEGGITAVPRDGSDVARLRAELQQAKCEADAGDRAKDRFLAIVSHELRTPLNAIIGFSDMVLGGLAGPIASPRQQEYVGLIREAGHHLLGLVNSILDVSKIESGSYDLRLETFRFRDAVEACTSMLSLQAAAKGVTVTVAIADTVGDVRADPRAVRQMLINLLANALKFTREGGHVTIGARRIGTKLRFWVEDDGIGIDASDLAKLGRPFQQVRNDFTREFEGTGLGLALVRGLVALHDGAMTIESAPGQGTTVTISLPATGSLEQPADGAAVHPVNILNEGSSHGALRKIA